MMPSTYHTFTEIPIRLTRREWEFYARVARAAQTDMNAVLVVVLALAVTSHTTPRIKIDTPSPTRTRKKAPKK